MPCAGGTQTRHRPERKRRPGGVIKGQSPFQTVMRSHSKGQEKERSEFFRTFTLKQTTLAKVMLRKKAVDPAEHRDFVPAPERSQQKFLCTISCQALHHRLGRQAKKLAAHNANVFLPCERGDRAVFPFAGKARAAENVQKMNCWLRLYRWQKMLIMWSFSVA